MSTFLYRPLFIRFVLYNFIFLSMQFGLIFSQGSSFIHTLRLPIRAYIELVATLLAHAGLYLILSVLQTALLWGVLQRDRLAPMLTIERWQVVIWWLSICALLTSNAYFFPLSVFSRLFLSAFPPIFLILAMLLSILPLGLLALNTVSLLGKKYLCMIGLAMTVVLGCSIYPSINPNITNQHSMKANIIIIGIDSLPPEAISLNNTPTLARFIHHAVQFKEVISPLARTYPAWTSILTGLYPQHHQAHYNLMPPDRVKRANSIAWRLQKKGYQTLFATDDRRFNPMGHEFGFQTIIGPKLGINDILLGSFNDYPLSNLVINSPLGAWLFPYNYINRASFFSYYPQFFNHEIHTALASRDKTLPLFFAVHFTLPHWPYAFASSTPAQVNDEYSVTEREQLYVTALQQADKQVASLLQTLQQHGYLEHSMVVLLSDHGETLYSSGSRQTMQTNYQGSGNNILADYFHRKTSTTLEQSAGHGSDLLSPSQYHCVLAFKLYQHGKQVLSPKKISTRVALIDIAPTIQAFAGIVSGPRVDGISLLNVMVNQATSLPERAFMMESGMLPNQFLTREKARLLGQQFFIVDQSSGQLQLRKDKLATLDAMKLYAIIKGDWLLALYPDDKGYIPIIQRLSDGKWVDNITADFARSSPAITMLGTIERFYNRTWSLQR